MHTFLCLLQNGARLAPTNSRSADLSSFCADYGLPWHIWLRAS
jgi:hypothetical protein